MTFALGAALAAFLAAGGTPAPVATAASVQSVPSVPLLEAAALKKMLASGEKILLVDVREPGEFAAGHIDGAKLMPLGGLEESYGALPKDTTIVVYCRAGHRSAKAVAFLMAHGYGKAVSLNGGYLAYTGPVQ